MKTKKVENFGCVVHHRVFFSRQEANEHIKKNCHPENIVKLKGENYLDHFLYNMISESIDAANIGEQEKEGFRQLYFW